ncbi:MAG: hypothetical protein ABSC49_04065 [Candidatus Microgenomates bacterium]|jgi:hypothetical protein
MKKFTEFLDCIWFPAFLILALVGGITGNNTLSIAACFCFVISIFEGVHHFRSDRRGVCEESQEKFNPD